jgi:hypothetical protein
MTDQAKLKHLRQEDLAELDTLLCALNGARNALRRDECGDWAITGSRGTVRACGGKYFVYIASGSALAWTWAKRKLASFTTVSQDGDEEGILLLDRMPTPEEAETLRGYIGLRQTQTRDVTPEQMQKVRDAGQKGSAGSPMRQNGPDDADPAKRKVA